MKTYINKISYILSGKYNVKILTILLLTVIMSILEVFSIALIIPLMGSLIEGGDQSFLSNYLQYYSNTSGNKSLIIILSLFLFIFLIKNIFLMIFNATKIRFAYQLYINTSNKLFKNYLYRDYSLFIKQNSSEFIRNVTGECNVFAFGTIMPIITLISDLIIISFISCFLLVYDFNSSLFVIFFILLVSATLLKFQNKKFKFWGKIRLKYTSIILQNLQESYGYIKEIIFSGSQKYFIERHLKNNLYSSEASIKRDVYSILPRPLLEAVALIAFCILIFVLLLLEVERSQILILIGVIFFASIKLLPSVSNIIKSLQSLKYNSASVDAVYNELKLIKKNIKRSDKKKLNKKFSKISFDDVKFSYDGGKKFIMNGINFKIKRSDKIGIMGRSGGGKTTFLNLLTGLLLPTSGNINIDNKNINTVSNQWKKNIGYVHQSTFLADDTILFNIALTNELKKKELERIWEILKIVDLDQYIKNLKLGLNTLVGERGSKISGGQCQRLGIARVLFSNPSILILDEATSALDEETQTKILKLIYKDMGKKTIITVSHRINTLKYCQKVFKLIDGKLTKH